jgi:hypothetical protein
MEQSKQNEENTENPIRSVLVWDLPTRLFYWLLEIFVIISFVTANIGGNALLFFLQAPESDNADDHQHQTTAGCGGRTRLRPYLVGSADCGTGRFGCLFSCALGHRPKTDPSAFEATLRLTLNRL